MSWLFDYLFERRDRSKTCLYGNIFILGIDVTPLIASDHEGRSEGRVDGIQTQNGETAKSGSGSYDWRFFTGVGKKMINFEPYFLLGYVVTGSKIQNNQYSSPSDSLTVSVGSEYFVSSKIIILKYQDNNFKNR